MAVNRCEWAAFYPAMGALATPSRAYSMAIEDGLDNTRALNQFLQSVERKAFRMAQIALRHEDDALDAVQDAMLQLARTYAHRPAAEWRPLFYRILENRIRDIQRRRTVRGRLFAWLPAPREDEDGAVDDPADRSPSPGPEPLAALQTAEAMAVLEQILNQLPPRQRQVFVLRNFEGMDVTETALAMGCSAGSVKTHYFRAIHTLRAQLEAVVP